MNDVANNPPLIQFKTVGRVHVGTIHVNSVLSTINIAEFGNELLRYVHERPGLNLLLNFEHVDNLSSAVLTELLRVNKVVQEGEGNLRLCAVAPKIREVFEITNLNTIFVIHGDDEDVNVSRFERSLDVAAQEAAWDDPDA